MLNLALFIVIACLAPSVPAQGTHNVECGPVDTACECDASAAVCVFQLYIERIFTFTKYNSTILYPNGQGEIFYIDEEGDIVSLRKMERCLEGDLIVNGGEYCINGTEELVCLSRSQLCSEPITVDGRTFKTVLAVNRQFPGPTLIVHEGQTVAVDVHNNLSSEAISIHWHGQHQINTNFMDGVGLLTQCPIQPGSSFRYIFTASPSGSFWYHSHMGSQRANGIFGALIVKEKQISYPLSFVDDPASHTITVMDWFQEDFERLILSTIHSIGKYPSLLPLEVPSPPTTRYRGTDGPDFAEIGQFPYWVGLFNGKGRHPTVPYEQSSLKVYEVEGTLTYRFRLIHTGVHYGFKFSIDGHKLIVMATDGYLVQPVEVDYISIQSGERYDFLLIANQTRGDYWIRAETFESDPSSSENPPYPFFDHNAEAILHYSGADKPRPSEYSGIPRQPNQCTQEAPCKMMNCPFGEFHASYNISCISVDSLRLVTATPASEMPDKTPDVTYFMNSAGFATRGAQISSINDKNFKLPAYPLTTHYKSNDEGSFCDVDSTCDYRCDCTTVMDIDFNVTVRVVMSAVGIERNAVHPMHIHGHSAHVVKIGYGEYSNETGAIIASSRDLTCTEGGDDEETLDQNRCPSPRFRSPDISLPLDEFTVRKDTIIVPSGG